MQNPADMGQFSSDYTMDPVALAKAIVDDCHKLRRRIQYLTAQNRWKVQEWRKENNDDYGSPNEHLREAWALGEDLARLTECHANLLYTLQLNVEAGWKEGTCG